MVNLFEEMLLLSGFCFLLLITMTLQAEEQNLYFRPTKYRLSDSNETGIIYSWPEYEIMLSNKNENGKYQTATIEDKYRSYYDTFFRPNQSSCVKIIDDNITKKWGVHLPGKHYIQESDNRLSDLISEYFTACLETLPEEDLEQIEDIISKPEYFLEKIYNDKFNKKISIISSKMYSKFKTNLCKESVSPVNNLIRLKSKCLLQTMLTGQCNKYIITPAAIAVFSITFKQLLFSPQGLWMRVSLDEIKKFLIQKMKSSPKLDQLSWMNRNYDSFIDFIIRTRENNKLSKKHYKDIAQALKIYRANQLFDKLPLENAVKLKRISIVNLHIGSETSTHFLPGGGHE